MSNYESLRYAKWDCTYHVVFIRKGCKRELYGKMRTYLKTALHELARQRESRIEKGSLVQDHVHMMIRIPPKYSVAEVVGYITGIPGTHLKDPKPAINAALNFYFLCAFLKFCIAHCKWS